MIDQSSITEWSIEHPWPKKCYVEQDLVIERAIVSIFADPVLSKELAWRGGTALHKLYLKPQARYSEDIDLVRTGTGPVKPIVERLDQVLGWLPGKSYEQRRFGFRMKFRYQSEMPPVELMRLKVEANTFEHFSVIPLEYVPFDVSTSWFSGTCNVTTYCTVLKNCWRPNSVLCIRERRSGIFLIWTMRFECRKLTLNGS